MTRLAVVIPSRNRPDRVKTLLWQIGGTTRGPAPAVFVVVDTDDPTLPEYMPLTDAGAVVLATPSSGHAAAINFGAMIAVAEGFTHVAKLDDDHWPRSNGWDESLVAALGGRPGIAYGDDGLQGEYLPTAPVISADIIDALGWMCPPVLTHLYVDNFWLGLGQELGCLTYVPSVSVEHRHPMLKDKRWPDTADYARVRSFNDHDRDAFAAYLASSYPADVAKVRTMIEGKG